MSVRDPLATVDAPPPPDLLEQTRIPFGRPNWPDVEARAAVRRHLHAVAELQGDLPVPFRACVDELRRAVAALAGIPCESREFDAFLGTGPRWGDGAGSGWGHSDGLGDGDGGGAGGGYGDGYGP